MSPTRPNVSIIGTAMTYLRARDLVSAAHLALGPNVQITLRTSHELLSDFNASGTRWAGVEMVEKDAPPAEILSNHDSEYVLTCPSVHVTALTGIIGACSLLDSHPEWIEIGGLLSLPGGDFWSGALRQIGQSHDGTIPTAFLEDVRPNWSAQGEFALTPADFLGGITLVRRANLGERHVTAEGFYSRALTQGRPAEGGTVRVFSGLVGTSSTWPEDIFSESESAIPLPPHAYSNWRESDLWQITVLHRGLALRNDSTKEVIFHSDSRIAAVDGRGDEQPPEPWDYYSSSHTISQLGPGFSTILAALVPEQTLRPGNEFRGTVQGLTSAERSALKVMRRIAGKLPPRVLGAAQRIIMQLGQRRR